MKLNILSDLHLSLGALERPENDADVIILAGDIARPREAASWASGLAKPVLYVPGNHEFYGSSIVDTVAELTHRCSGTNVCVLAKDEVIIGGVRFLGTTLWTDFMLFGTGGKRAGPCGVLVGVLPAMRGVAARAGDCRSLIYFSATDIMRA